MILLPLGQTEAGRVPCASRLNANISSVLYYCYNYHMGQKFGSIKIVFLSLFVCLLSKIKNDK